MSKYIPFRTKRDRISFFFDKKSIKYTSILIIVTLLLCLASTSLGQVLISPLEVIQILLGSGEGGNAYIVEILRLPRILIALFVGIGLAVSGAILQGMIRNPLASPDIIGITSGGSVAVVTFLTIFSNENDALTVSIHWQPVAAFIGAMVIGLIVYVLSLKSGTTPIRLVLIGIGLATLMDALTNLFMILGPIYRAADANLWLTGSVYGTNWDQVKVIIPAIVGLIILALLIARRINVQELGDELASGVGSHIQRDRLLFIVVSTALAGVSVSVAGGIGFVGLMAPHIARRLVGASYGALIPISALIGGILVVGADLIGRTLFLPIEVPAGVFTATIGAPYFIYLLFKK
ncbi:FecCD family ABC transporter permease [Pontibacillus yanchengensis]|uniref:Iron ABC transporter permease n=1 Tax=Pontibacillus yanchengensis Y32 TaxID=1385514 RepID=A0A0A2T5S9_9BACI|nr:iron ABC transporter permease [Pontibacillus yanchengensis]KGP70814.1 iron ABC transporter permease [Pontibacillus yanchengensis Y32]